MPLLALALAAGLSACSLHLHSLASGPPAASRGSAHVNPGSPQPFHLGVFEPHEETSFSHVTGFAATVGRRPNIVLSYSTWPEPFNMSFAKQVYAYGATPQIQMDPYGIDFKAIVDGSYDSYLKSFARAVHTYGHPVIIGFAHEMNGSWYGWGYHHVAPALWVAAWRHVVKVFRAQGAANVTWLWTVARLSAHIGPIKNWWPGSSYVTWVGIDGYYYNKSDTFDSIFKLTIAAARKITSKPIILAEMAAGKRAGRAAKIPGIFAGVKRYGLLGFVWFDEVSPNPSIYHQNWRIEGDARAAAAMRKCLRTVSISYTHGAG